MEVERNLKVQRLPGVDAAERRQLVGLILGGEHQYRRHEETREEPANVCEDGQCLLVVSWLLEFSH